jgi:predicted esterase
MTANDTAVSDCPSLFVTEPTLNHTHSFILLHGLGSNGGTFGRQLLETGICSDGRRLTEIFPGARFIFPTAKRRRSSAFSRAKLTQWFDIASLEDPWRRPDTQLKGLAESSKEILGLIDKEAQEIPHRNIIIGGLSHGCAMALSCMLALDFRLGGFIGMSGWLPFQPDIEELLASGNGSSDDVISFNIDDDPFAAQNRGQHEILLDIMNFSRDMLCFDMLNNPAREVTSIATPVFHGHGDSDEKVKPSLGATASTTLSLIGYEVTWKTYQARGHWYKIPDEIDDIVQFIRDRVGWELTGV